MATKKQSKLGNDPLAWMNPGTADAGGDKTVTATSNDAAPAPAKPPHPLGLDVETLESSFALLEPELEKIVAGFYTELFKRYPDVKPLFNNTTKAKQTKKLSAALRLVAGNLNNVDTLAKVLTELGERHRGYGVQPAHYDAVSDTLLDAMKKSAPGAWTEQVQAAWQHALKVVAEVMIGAQTDQESEAKAMAQTGNVVELSGEQQQELVKLRSAINGALTATMMVDRDLVITFVNQATITMLTPHQDTLRSVFPGFDVNNLVGANIDQFHKNPQHQRQLLSNPANFPYSTRIEVGPLKFLLNVTAIVDDAGEYIGNTLEWSNVTERVQQEANVARLQGTVDGAMTAIMMIDRDLVITYANDSTVELLKKHETVLRDVYPGFDVNKLLGTCIDIFHTNPSHQRNLLADQKNLPHTADIHVGPLVFQINVSAIIDNEGNYSGNSLEWSDVTDLRLKESEVARLQGTVDGAMTAIMMVDRELVITYANDSTLSLLRQHEQTLRSVYPGFSVDSLVGTCIDTFHADPAHQRQLLNDARNLPHSVDIHVGPLILRINVTAIMDAAGNYVGNALEWSDVTEQRTKEVEVGRLQSAIDGAQANLMLCDADLMITYANPAVVNMLAGRQTELRKVWPSLDAHNLIGTCIDGFHKNPAHQRGLLKDPARLPAKAEIKVGDLEFEVNATFISGANGEYLGNMVEWKDITEQKDAQRQIEDLIKSAIEGKLDTRIDAENYEGFMLDLAQGINRLMDSVVLPIQEGKRVMGALADGDLTQSMVGDFHGDFSELRDAINTSVTNLLNMVGQINMASGNISSGASEISHGNQDLSQRTEEQASSLEETASSMEQMTSTVKQNADNARQANQLASAARDQASKGGDVVKNAVDAMSEINQSSKKIADIIGVIDEIAFQTNLLALNAAVEAARAGEQGRGFAVVAGEVRNLAQRSAGAAKEIKSLISDSVEKVDEGSKLVDESGKTLDEIVDAVKKVSDIIAEIAAASQQQSAGIEEVNKAVSQMDEMTQQNAALVEEAAAASEAMEEQAKQMQELMQFFNTGNQKTNIPADRPAASASGSNRQTASTAPPAMRKASPRKPPKNVQGDDEWEEF